MEMPVAFEPFSGDSLHRLDSPKFGRPRSPEMDRLYRHGSIIYQAPVEASHSRTWFKRANQVRNVGDHFETLAQIDAA